MNIIKSNRTNIRFIEPEDWHSLKKIWNDFNESPFVYYDVVHDTKDEILVEMSKRWANATKNGTDHMFFAICIESEMIGFFSVNKRTNYHEIGYGFMNKFQGYGYAYESLKTLCQFLKSVGLRKLQAGTAIENESSTKLLEKVGFKLISTEQLSFHKDSHGNDILFTGGVYELELY